MFNTTSIALHSNHQPIKIHLISTGAVAVKTKFRENKYSGFHALLSFLVDKSFTEWLPIYVMIVEHPEGVFIIDAGEIAEVNDKNYFKSSGVIANWFDKSQFKFSVYRKDELNNQLQKLKIDKQKIEAIILTHLHFDHTDGIKYFPNTNIIVSKAEWQKPFGDLPKLYPSWFKPQLVELNDQYDVFDKAKFLTKAKDIILVETPGHTYHHCSVIIKTDECSIFFAADICYSKEQLLQNKFPGNNASNKLAQSTYQKVKNFAQKNRTVFIPSHDAEAFERLKELEVMTQTN
jgi:glyoxylase-like metal-dependent hydrolase (beta-lactamase superfamily II)